ncbi:Cytochrome b5 [Melia azedarach]|uniref:Cytochrome b5 n=2 Tax=Melia azedarach TaxID=155640 RepID=A0ACC1YIL0_MELAZ|nr:Cytochrome b5 [Melia azedarach]KAJ4723363.1 Cytochrome b5 [Melia azedarach]
MASETKTYTLEEVTKHDKAQDCWIIISNKVYDVTSFIDQHPGGRGALIYVAGTDATENFEQVGHSEDAKGGMSHFYIGNLHLHSDHKPAPTAFSATTTATNIQQQEVGDAKSGDQDYKNNPIPSPSHSTIPQAQA